MDFIFKYLSPEIVYSLGLMLIHMFWQGIIIALILAVFLLYMKKSSAQSRYMITVYSIFLFPVTSLITFIKVYRNINIQQELASIQSIAYNTTGEGSVFLNNFIEVYKQYLPVVVFIWFIGMTILLLRYLGLLIYVERLKNYLVHPVNEKIKLQIDRISAQFKVKKSIRALISSKVSSPMVIGHFRPVLLIPRYVSEQFNDEELDVVLHHELAHIKRNDYLVNVVQNIIEILFFFHPAMWWVSSMIRKEREECCDVFAVKDEKDKVILAQALTAIHEVNTKIPNMALSFMNRNNGLLNRITNLFGKPGMATFKEGLVVAFFFFFSISIMSFMVSDNKNTDEQTVEYKTVSGELANGKHIFAKVNSSGEIQKLFIEGKKVGNKKMKSFQPDVDSILFYSKIIEREKNNQNNIEDEQVRSSYNKKKNFHFDYDTSDDNLTQEEISEIKEEIIQAFDEVKKEFGLNIDINEEDSKVIMRANENGFGMDIDDGNDKVKMDFGPDGIYMNIEENGKTVFHMKAGENGFEMTVDDDSTKNKNKK